MLEKIENNQKGAADRPLKPTHGTHICVAGVVVGLTREHSITS